jgi:Tol biopolymer transport system component
MKRCPKCEQTYADETLNFCLEDGEWLLGDPGSDEPETAVLTEEAATKPWVADTGESPRSTSSAEYLVGEAKRHKAAVLAGAVVLIAGLIGAGWWISERVTTKSDPGPPKELKFVRLTSGGKVGDEPIIGGTTISPDGKYVVFWTNTGPGKSSIWLRQVSTNSLQRILGPFDGEQNGSTFSRDGQFLYYVSSDKANPRGALFQIPFLGGVPPRRILEWVSSPVTFSPDEKEIAFVRQDLDKGESSLVVTNADGSGTPRILVTRKLPEYFSDSGPSWSPDGRVIACGAGTISPTIQASILEVPAQGGAERTIATAKWARLARVLWLPDGSGLVADGYATPRASGTQIWHITYPEGNVRKITNDLNGYGQVSLGLTADGTTIATVQEDFSQPIYAAAPNDDSARARQVSHGKYEGADSLDTTLDGRIVYIDPSAEGNNIWIMNGDGSDKKQLTHDESVKAAARVSPDGRYIAFSSNRSGSPNIWRIDIDGNNPRQLTEGGTIDFRPLITPDGKWVVFESLRSGITSLWKVGIDGGEPVQLTSKNAEGHSISPDGKFIACIVLDQKAATGTVLGLLPIDGGELVKSMDLPASAIFRAGLAWTPDGRALTYLDDSTGYTNLVSRPIDGGPVKLLTNFKSDRGYRMFNFAWSRDGKQIIFSRGPFTDDVVLIKDFR